MTMNESALDPIQVDLRRAREAAGISRDELAQEVQVHYRTIVRWETQPGKLLLDKGQEAINAVKRIAEGGGRSKVNTVVKSASGDRYDLSQVPTSVLTKELTRRLEMLN